MNAINFQLCNQEINKCRFQRVISTAVDITHNHVMMSLFAHPSFNNLRLFEKDIKVLIITPDY